MQTRKRLCASCLKFNFNKTLKSSKKHKPKWLNKIDYVNNFINNYKNFNINNPINYNNKILPVGSVLSLLIAVFVYSAWYYSDRTTTKTASNDNIKQIIKTTELNNNLNNENILLRLKNNE